MYLQPRLATVIIVEPTGVPGLGLEPLIVLIPLLETANHGLGISDPIRHIQIIQPNIAAPLDFILLDRHEVTLYLIILAVALHLDFGAGWLDDL
jgi:hypothetical protein